MRELERRELERDKVNRKGHAMGWGSEPHEGWEDRQRADGSWSGPTHRGGGPDVVAYQAVCSCGWLSEREHPVPARPANVPRDKQGLSYGPKWKEWLEALEQASDACMEDWQVEHFEPLFGYPCVLPRISQRVCSSLSTALAVAAQRCDAG